MYLDSTRLFQYANDTSSMIEFDFDGQDLNYSNVYISLRLTMYQFMAGCAMNECRLLTSGPCDGGLSPAMPSSDQERDADFPAE